VTFIYRGGVRLHFSEEGPRDGPVLLMHTGGGGDAKMWSLAGYIEGLPGYRCVLLDHRGHGRSGRPTAVGEHALTCYVDDVMAVLDHLRVERAALMGYSDGARVAYAASARYPERVWAVIGLGAVGSRDEDASERRTDAADLRSRGMRVLIDHMAASESQRPPAWLLENLSSTPTEMFALELEGWADDPSVWDAFPDVTAPALLICGEDEEPNASGNASAAARSLPRGQAVALPRLGHLQVFWRSDLTLPIMRDFLAGLR
jgi:pimeloyl-ACP methyl ester carboxylesterase